MRLMHCFVFVGMTALSSSGWAQDEPFEEPEEIDFRISGEVKAHYRWSQEDAMALTFFPPEFAPVGRDSVELRTVSPGSSSIDPRLLPSLHDEEVRSHSGAPSVSARS